GALVHGTHAHDGTRPGVWKRLRRGLLGLRGAPPVEPGERGRQRQQAEAEQDAARQLGRRRAGAEPAPVVPPAGVHVRGGTRRGTPCPDAEPGRDASIRPFRPVENATEPPDDADRLDAWPGSTPARAGPRQISTAAATATTRNTPAASRGSRCRIVACIAS